MVFGPGGRDHDSQKIITFQFGDTKRPQRFQEKSRSIFENHDFRNSQQIGNLCFYKFGKYGDRKS